ncbi:hypothetical protein ACHAXT_007188 [Thalassiosira profunda]
MNDMSEIAEMLPGARGKGGDGQRQTSRRENPSMSKCTACGKGGESLKKCNACKSVKYCSRQCQSSDWRKHKTRCDHLKERNAELLDDMLAKKVPPPPSEDCPICFIPMYWETERNQYMPCCGKAATAEAYVERIKKRAKLKDSNAIDMMAGLYNNGFEGVQIDKARSIDLYFQAAALGSTSAHEILGDRYLYGENIEKDIEKATQHYQIAALKGNTRAWAMGGGEISLKNVQLGYTNGLVAKEDFEKALRAYKDSSDAMRSEQRDRVTAELQSEQEEPEIVYLR